MANGRVTGFDEGVRDRGREKKENTDSNLMASLESRHYWCHHPYT